jgi:hypothetical protein
MRRPPSVRPVRAPLSRAGRIRSRRNESPRRRRPASQPRGEGRPGTLLRPREVTPRRHGDRPRARGTSRSGHGRCGTGCRHPAIGVGKPSIRKARRQPRTLGANRLRIMSGAHHQRARSTQLPRSTFLLARAAERLSYCDVEPGATPPASAIHGVWGRSRFNCTITLAHPRCRWRRNRRVHRESPASGLPSRMTEGVTLAPNGHVTSVSAVAGCRDA